MRKYITHLNNGFLNVISNLPTRLLPTGSILYYSTILHQSHVSRVCTSLEYAIQT